MSKETKLIFVPDYVDTTPVEDDSDGFYEAIAEDRPPMKVYIENRCHHIAGVGDDWETRGYRTLSWVYAHGDLENMAGFDLCVIKDDGTFDWKTPRTENVTAVLPDGTELPAVMRLWVDRNLHWRPLTGLVMLPNDNSSLSYAEELAELGIMI